PRCTCGSRQSVMRIAAVLLILIGNSFPVRSQENAVPSIYRLNFTFTESDRQKRISEMQYALRVEENSKSRINIGARIPYAPAGAHAGQVHMWAVGVIIECTARQRGAMLGLDCAFESSAVAPGQSTGPVPSGFPPIAHTKQASVVTAVPLGKSVVLVAADDPATKHHLEITALAERID